MVRYVKKVISHYSLFMNSMNLKMFLAVSRDLSTDKQQQGIGPPR